ncbi:MAG: hypothetical protein ACRD15_07955 [Vicinamibacterales bacterium]
MTAAAMTARAGDAPHNSVREQRQDRAHALGWRMDRVGHGLLDAVSVVGNQALQCRFDAALIVREERRHRCHALAKTSMY